MRKIALTITALLLIALSGYCQTQSLRLTIKSDKQAYSFNETIIFMLTVENLDSKEIPLFEGYHLRTVVILDGKEYKNTGGIVWGGPATLFPKGKIDIAIELASYGITRDVLTVGKHNIVVKLNETLSNAIVIEVKEEKIPEDIKKIVERLLSNGGKHIPSESLTQDIQSLFKYDKSEEGVGKILSDGSYSKTYYFHKCNLVEVFYEFKDKRQEYRFSHMNEN